MARKLFGIEKGMRVFDENGELFIDIIQGSAAVGVEALTNDAPMGSTYQRQNGESWIKKLSGSGADKWIRFATMDDITNLSWRSERVMAATSTVAPANGGTIDLAANPFIDDEAPLMTAANFALGDHVIFGVGGIPKLMYVSNIAASVLTFTNAANPMVNNNMFIVRNYLYDSPADQEAQAIVHYDGVNIIKISDFNWSIATGINLSAGYVVLNGVISPNDSVEKAIAILDGNQRDLLTAIGIANGATDMGTYTGTIIPDNVSQRAVNQSLETAIDTITQSIKVDNVTAKTVVDSVLVDQARAVEWWVALTLASDESRVHHCVVYAAHNGTLIADATNTDDDEASILRLGTYFNKTIAVELSGVGVAQTMGLAITATAAVNVKVLKRKLYI